MDLAVLRFFESIRHPVLTWFFSAITLLGSDTVVILLLCCLLWAFHKPLGVRIAFAALLGIGVNQSLKVLCQVPRPWVRWPDAAHPVPEALAGATGYSFPSGHTAQAAALYGGLAIFTGRRWLKIACWVMAALIAVSRVYLGVHTASDVLVSLALGLLLLGLSQWAVRRLERHAPHAELLLLLLGLLMGAVTLLCAAFAPGSADLELALDGYKAGAMVLAFAVCWYVERRWVGFDPGSLDDRPVRKLAQLLAGIAMVLLLQTATKAPLQALLPPAPADALRYGLLAAYIGLWHPLWVRRWLVPRAAKAGAQ